MSIITAAMALKPVLGESGVVTLRPLPLELYDQLMSGGRGICVLAVSPGDLTPCWVLVFFWGPRREWALSFPGSSAFGAVRLDAELHPQRQGQDQEQADQPRDDKTRSPGGRRTGGRPGLNEDHADHNRSHHQADPTRGSQAEPESNGRRSREGGEDWRESVAQVPPQEGVCAGIDGEGRAAAERIEEARRCASPEGCDRPVGEAPTRRGDEFNEHLEKSDQIEQGDGEDRSQREPKQRTRDRARRSRTIPLQE